MGTWILILFGFWMIIRISNSKFFDAKSSVPLKLLITRQIAFRRPQQRADKASVLIKNNLVWI